MPFVRPTFVRQTQSVLCLLLLSGAVILPAGAQGRAGVGIDYRGSAPVFQSAQPVQPAVRMASVNPTLNPADRATARIDFRYPSQPVTSSPAPAPVQPPVTAPAPAYTPPPPQMPVVQDTGLQPLPPAGGQGAGVSRPVSLQPAPSAETAPQGEYVETGMAILYGDEFAGLPTANGEIFAQSQMTAAHPALPLPSLVHVTHLQTGREVVVRVNDRGPFEDGAQLQLSRQAATALGMGGAGRGQVSMRYLGPAPVLAPQADSRAAPPAPAVPEAPVRFAGLPAEPQDELLGGSASPAQAPPPRVMSLQAAPVMTPSGPMGDHFVQLASFTELGNAEAMYRSVEARMPVEIVPARINGADFFRVRVGPFPDRTAAEQVRARLHADGTADGRVISGH